jgi:Raf kinase inhibitor-like YbhB/YbcL family protein
MKSTAVQNLDISSPDFKYGEKIPAKYSCDGEGINPALEIDGIPEGTKTLALIIEDPDAPKGTYDHWLVWNIEPRKRISEHSNPGVSGNNSSGKTGYHPPCPPKGEHRYYFHVYALDAELDLPAGESREKLESAMEEHVIGKGTIMGKYR